MEQAKQRPRYWLSPTPTECQLTGEPIVDAFVDGVTKMGWMCLSPEAHEKFGRGLGPGRGQRYERQADGRWLKTKAPPPEATEREPW